MKPPENDELRQFAMGAISEGFEPYQKQMIVDEFIFLHKSESTDAWLKKQLDIINARLNHAIAECEPTLKLLIRREAIKLERLYIYQNNA